VSNLIKERRVTTTVSKAKIARSMAEKMVTLARPGTLSARRRAVALLGGRKDAADVLFKDIVPLCEGRAGGYTRVLKLGRRGSDGSEMAVLEWVGKRVAASETRDASPGLAERADTLGEREPDG
jgi:large subunit ribosomal protein L17